jgi:penicillin-binding protein 1A
MAAQMGIDTSHFGDPPVISTTLGTNLTHPVEMAQAYSVIAADGVRHDAQYVSKIVGPAGKVVWSNNAPGKRILSSEVARTETQMLTGVLKSGTAAGLSIGRPAAGKTGTTDDKADAWFVGYTPQITTAVWMGDPLFPTPMTNVGGISVFGATYPADIWKAYMEAAHQKLPVVDFAEPNEDLWPAPGRIDEYGRKQGSYYRSSSSSSDTTPTTIATVAPASVPPTSAPPIVSPTTSPPPVTKPPVKKPPKSAGP